MQAFDGIQTFVRGKSILIKDQSDADHTINIDNEQLSFRNTIKLDTMGDDLQPFQLDIFVDTDTYFTEFNAFVLGHHQMINPKEFQEGQLYRIVHKLENYKNHPERLLAQVEAYFTEFDADKSGALDRHELRNFLIAFFRQYKIRLPLTEEFVDSTFSEIDKDGDGNVDL